MNTLTLFRRDRVLDITPSEIQPPVLLVGADPQAMIEKEERLIAELQDRRSVIEEEISRLRIELANTEIAIEMRNAARNVGIAKGLMPGYVS